MLDRLKMTAWLWGSVLALLMLAGLLSGCALDLFALLVKAV